jgi:diguanylate cyclase (GGDEF)-like protein
MVLLQPSRSFVDPDHPPVSEPGLDLPEAAWNRLSRALVRAAEAERTAEEQRLRIAQLEATLYTDDLTGLYNRRALVLELEREIASCAELPEAAGLAVVLDLEGIRSINERFGAQVGDAMLRRAARALCAAARPQDVVARIGGDEFGVLLTQSAGAAGLRLAEGLRESFHAARLDHAGLAIPLRASFGWRPYGAGDAAGAVLAAADLAMARARRPG